MHWAVTGYKATETSRKHYHSITEGDGVQVMGYLPPEANMDTDTPYVAHVLRFNTGNIGMAMAAMSGAKERPFKSGNFPITKHQLDAFVHHVAAMAAEYNIPITRDTVFTHAEVEGQFGVKQRGKWDIMWLPGMKRPSSAVDVGDTLREMIAEAMYKGVRPIIQDPVQGPWESILKAIAAIFGGKKA